MDIRLPGMRIGTVAISPVKGGKLVGMDAAAARGVPGVHDVIRAGDDGGRGDRRSYVGGQAGPGGAESELGCRPER